MSQRQRIGDRYQRKDAGVVDRDGLENRCTLTGTQGSNPCLSANVPTYILRKEAVSKIGAASFYNLLKNIRQSPEIWVNVKSRQNIASIFYIHVIFAKIQRYILHLRSFCLFYKI